MKITRKMPKSVRFSREEMRYLKDLNKGYGTLVTELDDHDSVLTVTTAEQLKIEQAQ